MGDQLIPKRWFILAAAFCAGAGAALLIKDWTPHSKPIELPVGAHAATDVSTNTLAALQLRQTNTPWGDLERQTLLLQPDDFYSMLTRPVRPERWIFPEQSREFLIQLFNACDLTSAQRQTLLETNRWETLPKGYAIPVPDEFILGLSQKACQSIFPILARYPENFAANTPLQIPLGAFDERFADSGLRAEHIEMVRRLSYTNWGTLCFSAGEQMRTVLSTNEFKSLLKVLYSTPTVKVRVRIGHDQDVEPLVRYWGRGGREKKIRPLLEAIARAPEGGSLTISYLFPPFARLKLYTYPDPEDEPVEAETECTYTSLNFFSDPAKPQFLEPRSRVSALKQNYAPLSGPPLFGDLVGLLNSHNNVVHVCVYVADDLVFTKNGGQVIEPWVLMRISDLVPLYANQDSVKVVLFRQKEEPGAR